MPSSSPHVSLALGAATLVLALGAPAVARADGQFGAIAYARDNGSAGYTTRRATQKEASENAKSYCKHASCQVVVEFHDECAFFATGGPGKEGIGKAARPQDAEQLALRDCAARGGKGCKVVTWGCSKAGHAGQPPRDEWDLVEEDTTIAAEGGATLAARIIRPPGQGPFPLVVINHGSPREESDRPKMTPSGLAAQARRFAVGGWAAALVLRRGYGASTGGWAEGYGSCNEADYVKAGRASASDIASAVRHFQKMPYVDKQKVVAVGVSAGGFGSIAFGALGLPGVAAIINFAGGRGSQKADTVCAKDRLVEATKVFGRTAKIPTLWVYADNDHFFGPQLAQDMLGAYKASGGQATFVKAPNFGDEGHYLFSREEGIPVWKPIVNGFLGAQHLPPVR
jgi:dienelactone hydrolase